MGGRKRLQRTKVDNWRESGWFDALTVQQKAETLGAGGEGR